MLQKLKNLSLTNKLIIISLALCTISAFLGYQAAETIYQYLPKRGDIICKLTNPEVKIIDGKNYLTLNRKYGYNHKTTANIEECITQKVADNKLIVSLKLARSYYKPKEGIGNHPLFTILIPLEKKNINKIEINNFSQKINISLKKSNNKFKIIKATGIEK